MPQPNLRVQPPQTLDADRDPLVSGPPVQCGYGRWKVSRLKDIRAVHGDPNITVDLVALKAINYAIKMHGIDAPSIKKILRLSGRDHRLPNDDERRSNIIITKRLQESISEFDFDGRFADCIAATAGTVADVCSGLVGPLVNAWRGASLGMDSALGLEIETGIARVLRLLDSNTRNSLIESETVAGQVLALLDRVDGTQERFAHGPILHWPVPAFTAILPLKYICVSMLAKLADTPELQEELRNDAALRVDFIQETERYFSTFRYTFRQAGPQVLDLSGIRVPPRSVIILDLAAANRDPKIWEAPNEFRAERTRSGTATFGFGPMGCPGGPLSRRIMGRLLDLVLDNLRLSVPDGSNADRRGSLNPGLFRGYSFCPLAVERL